MFDFDSFTPPFFACFMKVFLLVLSVQFFACFCLAQSVSVHPTFLNFGEMDERKLDSLPVTLSSGSSRIDTFSLRVPFREFASRPFWVKDSLIVIPPGASKVVWVYARITHNVRNSGHLLIKLVSKTGSTQCHEVGILCQGRYSRSYYAGTSNLSEEVLKLALKSRLASGQINLSYDVARDKMYGLIDNINDSVTCVYTNRKAKFNTRSGATNNNFNCEHTFPQGFFNSQLPMRSDIHHLFSTDEDANNSRGNLPFGVAVPPFIQVAINAPSKNGGGRYEPQDRHKGNCARAMMYFVLRYQDYSNFYASQDAQLRLWHKQYPPLPADTVRHSFIFQEQGNRNPFVDYPQLADRIKSLTSFSVSDSVQQLNISSYEIHLDTSESDFPTGSVCVWNEGNKAIQIQNFGFSQGNVEFLGSVPSTFSLAKNQARKIAFRLLQPGTDTLKLIANQGSLPVLNVPVKTLQVVSAHRPILKEIRVFPSPSSTSFGIDGLDEGMWEITLSDFLGRNTLELVVHAEERPVQIIKPAYVKPGVYLLKAVCGSKAFRHRVVFE